VRGRFGFKRHREFPFGSPPRAVDCSVRTTRPGALTSSVCWPKPNIKVPSDSNSGSRPSIRNVRIVWRNRQAYMYPRRDGLRSSRSWVCLRCSAERGLRTSLQSRRQGVHGGRHSPRKFKRSHAQSHGRSRVGADFVGRVERGLRASSKCAASYSAAHLDGLSVSGLVRNVHRSPQPLSTRPTKSAPTRGPSVGLA